MSTEATQVKINRSAVNALASAIAQGLKSVNATGGLLHTVCKIARQQYRSKPIPKADVQAVLDELAESQNWSKNSIAVRQSEYRSVLQQYPTLEETMSAFQHKVGRCTWHDGIALSRLLRTKGPSAAVSAHAARGKKSAASDPSKLSRGDAKAIIAKLVKRVLKMTKIERTFRDALVELCNEHGVKV